MSKDFLIVGVLNATPDSYFDGGKHNTVEGAIKRVGELREEGADIIEVGGESTGPGSKDVTVEEELGRVVPVIKAIRDTFPELSISIDTYKSSVAMAAIQFGASMVNDVTAGRGDPEIFSVLSGTDAKLVLMYAKDVTPRTTIDKVQYKDVVSTILQFLKKRITFAESAGIARDRVIIDPGMGHFISADPRYSFEVLRRLQEFTKLAPVFISPSRKSFLAGAENLSSADRLPGTIIASAEAVQNGATYIRTHDVKEVRRGIEAMKCMMG